MGDSQQPDSILPIYISKRTSFGKIALKIWNNDYSLRTTQVWMISDRGLGLDDSHILYPITDHKIYLMNSIQAKKAAMVVSMQAEIDEQIIREDEQIIKSLQGISLLDKPNINSDGIQVTPILNQEPGDRKITL